MEKRKTRQTKVKQKALEEKKRRTSSAEGEEVQIRS